MRASGHNSSADALPHLSNVAHDLWPHPTHPHPDSGGVYCVGSSIRAVDGHISNCYDETLAAVTVD